MRKIIHNLRSQPESVRRHILHVSTFVLALILLLLWIYSLNVSLQSPEVQAKTDKSLETFSSLKANMIDGYNSISQ